MRLAATSRHTRNRPPASPTAPQPVGNTLTASAATRASAPPARNADARHARTLKRAEPPSHRGAEIHDDERTRHWIDPHFVMVSAPWSGRPGGTRLREQAEARRGPTGFRVPRLKARPIPDMPPPARSLRAVREPVLDVDPALGCGPGRAGQQGSVAELMFAEMLHEYQARPSPAEARSWERSIPVLARDLVEAGLDNVEVLLEHRLPLCSRRVDAVLAGRHPVTGEASYVVVELKQWSGAELFEDEPGLVVIDGLAISRGSIRWSRSGVLRVPRRLRAGPAAMTTRRCAAWPTSTTPPSTAWPPCGGFPSPAMARLFTGERRADFMDFLRSRLSPDVRGSARTRMSSSARGSRPSRQLLAVAAEEIRDREQFVLLDEQRVAYNLVLHATEAAGRATRRPS